MKIALEIPRDSANGGGIRSVNLTMALPFFRAGSGTLWHRVRSGQLHYLKETGQYTHTSIKYWCGNVGHISTARRGAYRGTLSADPGERAVHCATCEGKVTGMRRDGTNKILGRTVLFSPRI